MSKRTVYLAVVVRRDTAGNFLRDIELGPFASSVEGFHIAGFERGSTYEICGFVLQKGDNALEAEANARRIVACVNALEGYPTEFLERGGLRSGIKGGAQVEAALIEALEKIANHDGVSEIIARAALSKVRGA